MLGHVPRAGRAPRGVTSLVLTLVFVLATCATIPALASSPNLAPRDDAAALDIHHFETQRDAWRGDWRDVCIVPNEARDAWIAPANSPQQREALEMVNLVAREVTIGAPLLTRALDLGIAVCLLDHAEQGARGVYDASVGVIAVDRSLDDFETAIILVHELRHADVIARGVEPSLTFLMREAITVHLAMEADAHLVGILYAWHGAHTGKPGLWTAALQLTQHDDVARVLGAGLAAGVAPRRCYEEAFQAWFRNPDRVDGYRFYAAMAYVDQQDEEHAPVGCDCAPAVTYALLGRLPNGKSYDARPPDFW